VQFVNGTDVTQGSTFPEVGLLDSGSALNPVTDSAGKFNFFGSAFVFISNRVAETTTLSVVDITSFGYDVTDTLDLTWYAGPIKSLRLSPPSKQSLVVDSITDIVVTARDIANNVVPTESGAFVFTTTGSATFAGPSSLTLGSATISLTNLVAEDVTISATFTPQVVPTIGSAPQLIHFFPAAVKIFTIVPFTYAALKTIDSFNLIQGETDNIVVGGFDIYGNRVVDPTNVSVHVQGSAILGSSLIQLTNGVGSTTFVNSVAEVWE
jgi:hypothetical protein